MYVPVAPSYSGTGPPILILHGMTYTVHCQVTTSTSQRAVLVGCGSGSRPSYSSQGGRARVVGLTGGGSRGVRGCGERSNRRQTGPREAEGLEVRSRQVRGRSPLSRRPLWDPLLTVAGGTRDKLLSCLWPH